MERERDQIIHIINAMHSLLRHLLPENRPYAIFYLSSTWKEVMDLTYPLINMARPGLPPERFSAFERDRGETLKNLKRRLVELRYNIDGREAVRLISGGGRIEKVRYEYYQV